jgi:hypothetical protein
MATNQTNTAARSVRYSVDTFKNTNEKKVPFEELDYTVYKNNNLVVFATSERRLPCWIDILKRRYEHGLEDNDEITTKYEEIDNASDTTKCDKITLSLISKETKENIITITIIVGTGRIKVEGRCIKEWGSFEFDKLITLINHCDEPNMDATKDIDNFINAIFNKEADTTTTNSENMSDLMSMKTCLSTLESDFVEFAQNTKKTIQDLSEALTKKDSEINSLVDNQNKCQTSNQQLISDLTVQNLQLKDDIKDIQNKHKQLANKNSKLTSQVLALQQKINELIKDESTTTNPTNTPLDTSNEVLNPTNHNSNGPGQPENFSVPVNNRFDMLSESNSEEEVLESNQPPNETSLSESETTLHEHVKPEHTKPTTKHHEDTSRKNTSPHLLNEKSNNADTIILCDSNGRYINTTLLCPNSKVDYHRCPTFPQAKKIINNLTSSPKTILIHCGTNDLEITSSNSEITTEIENITSIIHEKHPTSRILLSTLLPRSDKLNERAKELNETLEKTFDKHNMITIIEHGNINCEHLRDKKHLDKVGVKLFASNLKRAYFNKQRPNSQRRASRLSPPHFMKHGPRPHFTNYRSSPPPLPFQFPMSGIPPPMNNFNQSQTKPDLIQLIKMIQSLDLGMYT